MINMQVALVTQCIIIIIILYIRMESDLSYSKMLLEGLEM